MEKHPTLTINLLKKKKTPSLDIILHWAITGGRFLVIVTETIALAAFLYRFTLDRQIIDLHENIKAKQTIVLRLRGQENSYRELQERLIQAQQLSQTVSFIPDLFSRVSLLAQKNNLSIKSFFLAEKTFHMEIIAVNVQNVKSFVTDLQNLKELKDISIDRIENRSATAQIAAVLSAEVLSPTYKIVGTLPTKEETR